MLDLISSFGLHAAMVALFATVLHYGSKRNVDGRALLLGLMVLFLYFGGVLATLHIQDQLPLLSELKFNWAGKILAICLTLGLTKLLLEGNWASIGLTLQQRDRSVQPSIIVAAGLCTFAWGVIWLVGNKGEPTAERLLYQATMPGLDEELFFRGLLLALMLKAFVSRPDRPSVWPAAVAVTFLFAAGHTLMFQKGALSFDPFFFGYVAILGAGLMWIRLRTGSVLLPVITHNIINFGNIFIPG